ncbi:sciellin [Hyla sarda]|uniref:sciellin n=1 Tax=Hyla sarda TaxID=327740 RepID=UPI0024C3E440|nr:sciellin [Hyla sarda]XP_056411542.1 sciellin [Hyla sarda]
MSTFSFNKSGNDAKSNTLGSTNRQNVIQETNKKRTLLKDSSWIKNRPEEEEEKIRDENYGKSVLSRYRSQEDLDSGFDKDEKPLHNRFKSDDALDRIPSRNTFQGGNKAATLERLPMSGPEVTNKRQSWAPSNKTTTTTTTTEESTRQSWAPSNKTTTTTTTTEESKSDTTDEYSRRSEKEVSYNPIVLRKSWAPTNRNTTTTTTTATTETRQVVPGKPEGQKITISSSDTKITDKQPRSSFIDSARSRFEKSEENPSPPTSPRLQNADGKPKLPPRSPIAKTDGRPSYPSKPVISETGERRSTVERKQRSQDIDNLIDISTSTVVNKSTQDIDNLIDIKHSTDKGNKSTQDIGNLIDIKPSTTNGNKRDGNLNNLIEVKKPTVQTRDQLDEFIEISNAAKNVHKTDGNLNNLIEVKKPTVQTRTQNLDNLIDINTTTTTVNKRSQGLEDLIAITGDGNKGTAKPTNLTNQSSTTTTTYNVKEGTSDAPSRRSTTTTTYNVKEETSDAPNRRSTTTSKVTENQDMQGRRSTTSSTYKVNEGSYDAPTRRTTTSYKDTTDGPSSSSNVTVTEETSYSSFPSSSYGDASRKSSTNKYGQDIVSNSIRTVYSTSDQSNIGKDVCTYCRKPLGIDAKMILKDLNICCHATCFKCEACSGPLENLKAGDSMWIYKQTIHCEPCYFSAREKWII